MKETNKFFKNHKQGRIKTKLLPQLERQGQGRIKTKKLKEKLFLMTYLTAFLQGLKKLH